MSWLEVLAVIRIIGFVIYQPRARLTGIAFAPEKDGSTFLSGAFRGPDRDTSGRY